MWWFVGFQVAYMGNCYLLAMLRSTNGIFPVKLPAQTNLPYVPLDKIINFLHICEMFQVQQRMLLSIVLTFRAIKSLLTTLVLK